MQPLTDQNVNSYVNAAHQGGSSTPDLQG